eukprot:6082102-Alexandrium_andersonii.AAC.1
MHGLRARSQLPPRGYLEWQLSSPVVHGGSGSFTLHVAQSAIRNLPKARQYCNPPQSTIRPSE